MADVRFQTDLYPAGGIDPGGDETRWCTSAQSLELADRLAAALLEAGLETRREEDEAYDEDEDAEPRY